MSALGKLHDALVVTRRVDVLASWFARLAPMGALILDVGCGNGLVSAAMRAKRPDLTLRGIDVLPRKHNHIPVEMFDGTRIPFDDNSFDAVLFSDVLHHTNDPAVLLREARRVARRCVLIKDHFRQGPAAYQRLRFMDWVGNARFGVALPYNYLTENQWQTAWEEAGLQPEQLVTRLGLYPPPANWVFGARLHFVVSLVRAASSRAVAA